MAEARSAGVVGMAVNGSCEADWEAVAVLARAFPEVIPSFGYHPWFVAERSAIWEEELERWLGQFPNAGVGEVGLDRWREGLDLVSQAEVFALQMGLAVRREVPVSVHCLQAWGALWDAVRAHPVPPCGFLLHSYGGPVEMVGPLARSGAYFSFPGHFLHERKGRQRETFKVIPLDRLLVETDAPDQVAPESHAPRAFHLPPGPDGVPVRPLMHPADLGEVYRGLAALRGMELDELCGVVESNWCRLFLEHKSVR